MVRREELIEYLADFQLCTFLVFLAGLNLRPGSRSVTTDACVPVSTLPEMLMQTRKDIEDENITGIALSSNDQSF